MNLVGDPFGCAQGRLLAPAPLGMTCPSKKMQSELPLCSSPDGVAGLEPRTGSKPLKTTY